MGIKKESTRNVVEKLNSYAVIQKNIEYIEKKLKMIESELSKIKVSKLEENRGGVNNYRIEKLLDEKTKLVNKLNDLKLEKKFIIEAINSLEGIEREIIIDFYFKNHSIFKISANKNYSERYIRKIRNNALSKLLIYLN